MTSGISNANTYRQAETNFEEPTPDLDALVKALREHGFDPLESTPDPGATDRIYQSAENVLESTDRRPVSWIRCNRC